MKINDAASRLIAQPLGNQPAFGDLAALVALEVKARKPLDVEELSDLLGLFAGGVVPVADETPGCAVRLAEAFAANGLDAAVVQSVERAVGAAGAGGPDVVILDLTPRALRVTELADSLVGRRGRVPLVVLAGHPSRESLAGNEQSAMSVTECFASPHGEAYILERVERIRKSHE